ITMQDVARAIGYDHHYLSNLVQKGLGTTFRTLLNEYRISHAQYLLISGQDTVVSIADACGYDSLCSFNRNFKEITGTTPTAYRNGMQDHKAAVRN
ncbi:MAG: helix-turn-helix transcriptional regulator, partial [Clostridia bacterium]|nr:helix-turn-helix transcriptional regulator [Clostridia bacterium]